MFLPQKPPRSKYILSKKPQEHFAFLEKKPRDFIMISFIRFNNMIINHLILYKVTYHRISKKFSIKYTINLVLSRFLKLTQKYFRMHVLAAQNLNEI